MTVNYIFYDSRLDPHRVKVTEYGHNNGKFRIAFRFHGWIHIIVVNRVTGGMCMECCATKYFNYTKDDALIGMTVAEATHHALNIMVTAAYSDIAVVARPEDVRRSPGKGN